MDELSEGVALRPTALDDVDVLARLDAFQGQGGEDARDRVRKRVGHGCTLLDDGFLELCVVRDGYVVGAVQARSPKGAFPPGVCEIGITLLPEERGRGVGRIAVAAFTAQLLREGWARVQASTPYDNHVMRRLLRRTGYSFEGVLRAYAPGEGGRKDYAMYATLNGY